MSNTFNIQDQNLFVPSSGGAVIYVSNESNATDTRGGYSNFDPAHPFATLKAAITAASTGNTIVVKPGTYAETGSNPIQLKDRITIFAYGAQISGSGALINDFGGAVTAKIYGGRWSSDSVGLYPKFSSTIDLDVEDLTGTNAAAFSDAGTNYVQVKVQRTAGYYNWGCAGELVIIGDLTSGIGVSNSASKVRLIGNASGSIPISVTAGFIEGWGEVTGTSDALHAEGGTIIWHGRVTSTGDCGVYCSGSDASITVYGPVTSTGTVCNLSGRGDGICASVGTVRIHGDVSGAIGVVCGDADVQVFGDVSSTTSSGGYIEQTPQLDADMNYTEYRPATASAQGDYLGCAVVKVAHFGGGRLVIHGRVSSAYGHAAKLDAGTLIIDGDLVSTDGCALKQTGGAFYGKNGRLDAGTLASLGTCTAVAATDVITVSSAHNRNIGDAVNFTTTTTLPAGLVAGTDYYVLTVPSSTTMTVSATAGGSTLDITSTGTGTHTIWPSGNPVLKSGGTANLNGNSLIAGTTPARDSINAPTAQNVVCLTTTFANKAKNANVTIQVGTLTADANVT